MRYLIYLLTMFSVVYGQEYYQKNGVEGYILKADVLKVYKDDSLLAPNVTDIDCFEKKLKEKVSGYYADFYRQYYSKKIGDNFFLMVTLVKKTKIEKKEWLKNEPYIVLDGCESIRHIIYDIKKQQITRDVNGGGCDS